MHNFLKDVVTRLLSRSPVLRILVVGRLLGPFGTLLAVLIAIIGMGLLFYFGVTTAENLTGLLLLCGALSSYHHCLHFAQCQLVSVLRRRDNQARR